MVKDAGKLVLHFRSFCGSGEAPRREDCHSSPGHWSNRPHFFHDHADCPLRRRRDLQQPHLPPECDLLQRSLPLWTWIHRWRGQVLHSSSRRFFAPQVQAGPKSHGLLLQFLLRSVLWEPRNRSLWMQSGLRAPRREIIGLFPALPLCRH